MSQYIKLIFPDKTVVYEPPSQIEKVLAEAIVNITEIFYQEATNLIFG
jgi:hypothetical protein